MNTSEKLEAAKKRVDEIRGFYYHLTVYLIVNLILLIFRTRIVLFFFDVNKAPETGFSEWVDLNILITPLLWGVALFIHYVVIFGMKPRFIRNWEKRKLEQFLKEEEEPKQKWM